MNPMNTWLRMLYKPLNEQVLVHDLLVYLSCVGVSILEPVIAGGKKESEPAGRHNRMRTAPSEKVFFYEIENERWIPLDDLSTPRINPTVTVINGGLYCCGGLSPNPSDPDMVMSNPETEQLKELNDKWQKNDIHFNQHTHSIR